MSRLMLITCAKLYKFEKSILQGIIKNLRDICLDKFGRLESCGFFFERSEITAVFDLEVRSSSQVISNYWKYIFLKSYFKWIIQLISAQFCIAELSTNYLNYPLKATFQKNLLLVVKNNPRPEPNFLIQGFAFFHYILTLAKG